jgi:hypothetical protein
MPVERGERVIAIWLGSTGNGRNPMFNGKAAAFVRWHEPYDARVSSPDLWLGVKFPGLLGPKRPTGRPGQHLFIEVKRT